MWLAQKGNKGPYSRGYGFFQWSCMDVRVGLCKKAEHRRIDASELWCWRRLLRVPWTARRSNQSILKEISPGCSLVEDWCWSWNSSTLATWCKELTHLKRPWCWERLRAGGEGDDRGWDGWTASLTPWTWVWVNSRSWWWTGRPGVLQFMGSQRVGHDWAVELNNREIELLIQWYLHLNRHIWLLYWVWVSQLYADLQEQTSLRNLTRPWGKMKL